MKNLHEAKNIAIKISTGKIIPYFLYQIDHEDGIKYELTAREDYICSAEFYAFNGHVIAEFYDGVEC